MSFDTMAILRRFASALDEDDYQTLEGLLSADCEYFTSKETLVGPKAIIESYRNASTWAKSNIQSVRYESTVRPIERPSRGIITFIDHLEHNGHTHSYSCEQIVEVNRHGRVGRIIHREIPGQREATDAFLRIIGVRRA